MANPSPVTIDRSGFIRTKNNLLVPPGYNRNVNSSSVANAQRLFGPHYSTFASDGFAYGLRLNRDPATLVIRWAAKGSGQDDLINQAIADGNIANAGIAPVLFAQLNGLMKRRQTLAYSTSVVVSGRTTPATRATDAIARFNDSPLGATDAIKQIIYQLDTYNRGAPIATVPIIYHTDQWQSEHMTLIPIQSEDKSSHEVDGEPRQPDKYYLQVDWAKRKTPIPYLPNPFDLEPTGNNEWPYWYRTTIDQRDAWILLHQSQILSVLPNHSGQPGLGTSAVWICLGFLGEYILAIDERFEALIDTPDNGLLAIGGVTQTATEIRNSIEYGSPDEVPITTNRAQGAPANAATVHDWTLITAPNDITIQGFRFRKPDQVDFAARRNYFEDILALAFDEPIQAVVVRGGVGYGTQAETASSNVAEGAVFGILKAIEVALGTIYPRVTITVSKVNDKARQLQLALLDKFASAIAKLPENTFTRDEIRALIDRDILTIPTTNGDLVQSDARAGSGSENDEQPQATSAGPGGHPASAYLHAPYGLTILTLLADLDDILQQMLALQPDQEFHNALAQAQLLTGDTLLPIAQPATHPQIILARLKYLEALLRQQ